MSSFDPSYFNASSDNSSPDSGVMDPIIGIGIELESKFKLRPPKDKVLNNKVDLARSQSLVLTTENCGHPTDHEHLATAEFVSLEPIRSGADLLQAAKDYGKMMLKVGVNHQRQEGSSHKSKKTLQASTLVNSLKQWTATDNLTIIDPYCVLHQRPGLDYFESHVQLTRSIPFHGIYAYVSAAATTKAQELIIKNAKQIADEYVDYYSQTQSTPLKGKDAEDHVWQIVFLTVWMATSYVLVDVAKELFKNGKALEAKHRRSTIGSRTICRLARLCGKSFYDTLPRFAPGDFLRLEAFHDGARKHFQTRFSRTQKEKKNKRVDNTRPDKTTQFLTARILKDIIPSLITALEGRDSTKQLLKELKKTGIEENLKEAIKSCLMPGYAACDDPRYPDEKEGHFGRKIKLDGGSICPSSTQFVPRFERSSEEDDAPALHALFETRRKGTSFGPLPHYQELITSFFANYPLAMPKDGVLLPLLNEIMQLHSYEVTWLKHAKRDTLPKLAEKQAKTLKAQVSKLSKAWEAFEKLSKHSCLNEQTKTEKKTSPPAQHRTPHAKQQPNKYSDQNTPVSSNTVYSSNSQSDFGDFSDNYSSSDSTSCDASYNSLSSDSSSDDILDYIQPRSKERIRYMKERREREEEQKLHDIKSGNIPPAKPLTPIKVRVQSKI
jgi:hypothetical protein